MLNIGIDFEGTSDDYVVPADIRIEPATESEKYTLQQLLDNELTVINPALSLVESAKEHNFKEASDEHYDDIVNKVKLLARLWGNAHKINIFELLESLLTEYMYCAMLLEEYVCPTWCCEDKPSAILPDKINQMIEDGRLNELKRLRDIPTEQLHNLWVMHHIAIESDEQEQKQLMKKVCGHLSEKEIAVCLTYAREMKASFDAEMGPLLQAFEEKHKHMSGEDCDDVTDDNN